jgi:hypothetical protein
VAYRRIFVPAEKPAAWPRDGEKFLPIVASEFNAWVAAANQTAGDAPAATIRSATYSARLEGGQLVGGRGEWAVELRGGRPAWLPLGELSLAIREPRWRGDAATPARLGAWGKHGAAAVLGLEAPQAGTLEFAWHAAARATPSGIEIPWRVPPATSTRLILDLPAGMEPAIDGGLVIESDPREGEKRTQPALRRWTLSVGPAARATLRINDARRNSGVDQQLTAVREELYYHIGERGLELTSTLHFDEPLAPRSQLAIRLPEDVKLISAVAEGRQLSWQVAGSETAAARALIEIPDDVRPAAVVIQAWRELLFDEPWALPKLRADDTVWDSGSVRLTLEPALEVRGLLPTECVQTNAALSDVGNESETFSFAAYSAAANVEVTIGRTRPAASAWLGAMLTAGDADIAARLVTQMAVTRGSFHMLRGDLPTGWTVESVETMPADTLREWFVEGSGDHRQMVAQFARALGPGQPLTIVVQGRLQRSRMSEPFAAETLRMVAWRDVEVEEHLLSMQAAPPLVVEGVGMPPTIAAEELDDEECELFADEIAGTLFDLARAPADASLRLIVEPAQFAADVEIDAQFTGRELYENWSLTVRPQKGRADRLLVYFTEPLAGDVRWIEKSSGAAIAAERLPAEHPRRARLPGGGELWQLRLPPSWSDSIVIDCEAKLPWPARAALPLVSLPEARQQTGHVRVRGEPGVAFYLEPSRMTAAALPPGEPERENPSAANAVRAAYRYDPKNCQREAPRPQLWLAGGSADETAGLVVVRRLELESTYSATGQAAHRATYQLENRGAASFRVILPADTRLESAEIDGEPVLLPAVAAGPPILIPLPHGSRRVTAILVVSGQQSPLGAGKVLKPPVDGELAPLSGEWTIRLPGEFSVGGDAVEVDGLPIRRVAASANGPFNPQSAISDPQSTGLPGWRTYKTAFVARGPRSVTVTRPSVSTAWSMSLFLLCVVGGVQLGRGRRQWLICLIATAASLSLLLPAALAPLAMGSLLGLLFSLLGGWPRRVSPEEVPTKTWPKAATTGATAIVCLALIVTTAAGQELSTAPQTAARAKIHRVLIPINQDGQLASDKFYVGEELLRVLLRDAGGAGRAGSDWLMLDADCGLELHESPEQPGIAAGNAALTLNIETLARDTAVELPLVREEAEWIRATIDGIPCSLAWNAGGRGCRITIAEPGRCQLRIDLVPRVREIIAGKEIGLTLPPLLGAGLKISFPKGFVGLDVSGASGPTSLSEAGKWKGELDATGRLAIRWPRQDVLTSDAQSLRVEELNWLHVSAEGVILDVKYVIEGARRPAAITLFADTRWALLPDDDLPAKAEVEALEGARQSIRVATSAVAGDRSEAALRFRWEGISLPGNRRLPPIETASLPLARRWLGVSGDADWECEISGGGRSAARTFDEFLTAWNGKSTPATGQSAAAMVDSGQAVAWRVAVRPRRIDSSVDEALQIAACRDQLRLLYRSQVKPGDLNQFQLSLAVPTNLTIDRLVLTQAGRSIPIRWVRQKDQAVQVFFGEKVTGPYRVVLVGRMPADASGTLALPIVAISGRDAPPPRVWLYREEDRQIELRGIAEPAPSEAAPIEPPPAAWNVRPSGCYQLARAEANQAVLAISPIPMQAASNTLPIVAPQAPPEEPPSAGVRLADSVVLEGRAGDRVTSTRFVVLPSRLIECQLQLPSGEQLTAVNLDDRPAMIRPLESQRFAVPLGPSGLPHYLEVVTCSVAGDASVVVGQLSRPTLLVDGMPLTVELSLWTIGRPRGEAPPRISGASPVPAIEQEALRLERLISMVEAATPIALAMPVTEGDAWYVTWAANLSTLREEASTRTLTPGRDGGASLVAATTDEQLARIGQRVDAWMEQWRRRSKEQADRGESQPSGIVKAVDSELAARYALPAHAAAQYEWTYCVADGAADRLTIERALETTRARQVRAAGLLAILAATAASIWMVRRQGTCDIAD